MNNIVFTRESGKALREKLEGCPPKSVFLLTDSNTRAYCMEQLDCSGIPEEHIVTMSEGESCKSIESVGKVWEMLSHQGARRNSVLVNVGGGVVTDVGGFAASCFKRGIRCINIPTTLLAQVDASVGGKTGINFNGLKNEIGTFSIPEWVIIDNCFLQTLSVRQLLSGYAEMLKHALLADETQLAEVMNADLRQAGGEEFLDLIRRSVQIKSAIVQADPKEKGIRKALNFGHTVGHAIESVAIEKGLEIYHGDAVAYGMIAELYLSVQKLDFPEKLYEGVRKFIFQKYLPYHAVAGAEELYELMLHDKKNERDGVNFTLLSRPGEFEIDNYCSHGEILEALKHIGEG